MSTLQHKLTKRNIRNKNNMIHFQREEYIFFICTLNGIVISSNAARNDFYIER